jgi:hypothetical protein
MTENIPRTFTDGAVVPVTAYPEDTPVLVRYPLPGQGQQDREEVPGIRRIRREMHVGQPRAPEVRTYLAELART